MHTLHTGCQLDEHDLKTNRNATAEEGCEGSGLISVEQALAFLLDRARAMKRDECVAVREARGRVVSRTQHARVDIPGFDNSAMDGYAMHGVDVDREGPIELAITQRVAAGCVGGLLARGEAARIFTGAALPAGADTVVMQEHCEVRRDVLVVQGPVPAGRHVRPRGNNVAAGSEVLSRGTRMRPQEMGLAAAAGLERIPVYARLRVAFFSSGDELVEPGTPLGDGQIYNSNRYSLLGLLDSLGCETCDLGIVADDEAKTRALLLEAAGIADVVITSGGVSVGEEDHVKSALESVGRLHMWQVAVKPGKPLTYGRIGDADFLGLPGNPVSTLVTFCLFVRPFILKRQGVSARAPVWTPVRAGFERARPSRRREYLRARLSPGDNGVAEATVFPRQGSDVLASTAWADGLVEIMENTRVARGDLVRYLSFAEILN